MILKVSGVSKWFGAELVLNNVSFILNAGERVGLVGENGVGKSTLLRIIAGEVEADSGQVVLRQPTDVGYLPQDIQKLLGQTLAGLLSACQGRLSALMARMRELEAAMSSSPKPKLDEELREYGELAEAFELLGGYDIDFRIEQVLDGLGLSNVARDRDITTLSGGQKTRVRLAALLLQSPELLLLDEPTNHLDFGALEWLERYLTDHAGAILVVSHDRRFLNRVAHRILEIPAHSREIKEYVGNYDAYLFAKVRERAQWEEEYKQQREEIAEVENVIRTSARQVGHVRPARDRDKITHNFFRERVQRTVSRNVRSAEERLRRLLEEAVPRPPEHLRIHPEFRPEALRGRTPVRAIGVAKSFDGNPVLVDVDLVLRPESRVVLIGPNGAGKTTLLRILAGILTPDAGVVQRAPGVEIGYLDQEQGFLDDTQALLEAYREGLVAYEEDLVADLVRFGLFRRDDLNKRLSQLSVGQKRKLQIARLVATRGNVLLLDEPTNHVHFDILEEFERALSQFAGPVLAVSHDRWFIERFARAVWELRDGRLREQSHMLDCQMYPRTGEG